MSDKDLSSIRLPLNWKVGSDLMSKLLFNNPMIVNLVSKNIPADSYKVTPNEWADGTRSDVVYSVRDKSTVETPPILIEFQSKVSSNFMGRLIRYSLSCEGRYNVYPIVLIFAINGFSSLEVEKEFVGDNGSPFLKIGSKFWAKECLLISQSSIEACLNQTPLDPIVALGYFLTSGSLSLNTLEHKLDHTVQQLYQTSYKLVMAELKHKNKSVEPLQSLLEQVKRRIETVVDEDNSVMIVVVLTTK
ncbi:uncharacterized protein BX663DRAFT_547485 [Cokeromyces recurvatus]|uniref:uncharacterized protein n=1 Tax=Cokeromyces recurvatus TaxID=90255 RepID=UPI00221F7939|nr:uncharacterized protein BX663DRAFT_547485 [Cokeromyces recurvatus]KAI7907813.1 hypothetical protein BX663DRAFT_547485 [Cokeromyces recurvatus]